MHFKITFLSINQPSVTKIEKRFYYYNLIQLNLQTHAEILEITHHTQISLDPGV